jgi:hypothetical protein
MHNKTQFHALASWGGGGKSCIKYKFCYSLVFSYSKFGTLSKYKEVFYKAIDML